MRTMIHNPGVRFIARFLLLFVLFYMGTELMIGLCAPGGWYSPFLEKYFNYVAWIRFSVLKGAQLASYLMGLDTFLPSPFKLRIVDGPAVQMVYSCVGYGVMSFWAAFILAQAADLRRRLKWLIGGLAGIWFINCWRVALLLYTMNLHGNINRFAEHHTIFNIVCYTLIFIMMYFFGKQDKMLALAEEHRMYRLKEKETQNSLH